MDQLNSELEVFVNNNLTNIKLRLLFLPILLLSGIVFIILWKYAFSAEVYIEFQKELFFDLNRKLSKFPILQINLTHLGDVFILFPLLTIFIVYALKLWGALLTSSLITCITSFLLKELFFVSRPSVMRDNDSFVILVGKLSGFSSLPSGH